MMRTGYACLAVGVPGSEMKSCLQKNASETRLLELIGNNLDALEKIILYNIHNHILLFRISSDLIPFGSSLSYTLPWPEVYMEKLSRIGQLIRSSGMRVSMHPGQYTVLNSLSDPVVERAILDLKYHAKVLDSLGLGPEHKLILHLGGAYGNKPAARKRFLINYARLDSFVQRRLVLENDDKIFHIRDVLETASQASIPVVFDNLHNFVNPADKDVTESEWISLCSQTWKPEDGPQKIHYAQQNPLRKSGSHSETILIDPFLEFCNQIRRSDLDIMLEVKDKNVSAIKCSICLSPSRPEIHLLEEEWARYKYNILEHSSSEYLSIRQLFRNKDTCTSLDMYHFVEAALQKPVSTGSAVNAAEHVWGYFKNKATESEKRRFQKLLQNYQLGSSPLESVKANLSRLAVKYQEDYLLCGYYFHLYKGGIL